MFDSFSYQILLAQGEGGGWQGFLIIMLPALIFMIIAQVFFGRSESKEKARRDRMLDSLKKNDPVVTIGGILGTVVSISEDKREVTIKVDDNTRLKVQSTAIRELVSKNGKEKEKSGE